MESSGHASEILELIDLHHDGKWGFVVYRCTYDDDTQWTAFMARLTAFAMAGLNKEEENHKIKDTFAWTVQEDEIKFDNASKDQIRRYHEDWVQSVAGDKYVTKYTNCIYADQEVIDAVLNGDRPDTTDPEEIVLPTAFVKVLDDQFEAEDNLEDRGYEPVDGYKVENVSWMKVTATDLIPGIYIDLLRNNWLSVYIRPPGMSFA